MFKGLVGCLLSAMFLVGCSSNTSNSVEEDSNSATYQGPAETPYCAAATPYTGSPVTVSGVAQYVRREVWGDYSLGGLGRSNTTFDAVTNPHPATIHPIRHAEVRVTDGSGRVVQCAETDDTGAFSFQVPSSGQSLTVSVNSRALNNSIQASILDKPATNQFYSLTAGFVPDATKSLSTLVAPANGTLLGGAFNIFDQILNANNFIRSKAGTCGFSGCADFTVAPKVAVYWMPGFNPNSYFQASNSGLSFYMPGYFRLFILGGINGDVDHSDTDHFDNAVIIHEYGHFLENAMFASDSPGGSHNGNRVIDPRLAWSEGWGDFIQGAVRGDPHYIDTVGNEDGGATDLAFYVDLETPDGHDTPNADGEGNFREFAVTRMLWDIHDTTNTDVPQFGGLDDISDRFVEIWAALTRTTGGFKDGAMAFRNVGLLHLIQRNLQAHESATDWSNVRKLNRHDGDESHYAQLVTTSGSCSPYTFQVYGYDAGFLSTSDLFNNNRFYHLHIANGGSYTLTLQYQDTDATGDEKDLDLYLYNSSARFGVTADIVKFSRNTPAGPKGANETEAFTAQLSPGDYLINVNVYTGGNLISGAVNYTLQLNGSALCPADSVPP